LALLAATLLVAGAIAACGGDGEATDQPPQTPQGRAEGAGFKGVHSGELEIALRINRLAQKPEGIDMRISGSFMGAGQGGLPEINVGVESHGSLAGDVVDFNSGLVLLPEEAVVSYGPTEKEHVYQPDKATFEELRSDFEDALGEGGEGDADACLEAAGDFDLAKVLRHVSAEGEGETLDSTPTKVVGADLDVPAAIDELIRLSEDEGCRAQLEAVGVPVAQLKALEGELKNSLAAARVTLEIDKNGVIRSLKVLAKAELVRNQELEVELLVRLGGVNEVTELPESGEGLPIEGLLKKFGVDLQQVEEADSGERLTSLLEAVYLGLFERGSP
jgi:hypothetical protein